ncbi:MAG: GspE/PulE family protein [Rhodocyclaceae bacterium]|nr:GspE/PulE family protein [Rhodocyclaceae bacterium]
MARPEKIRLGDLLVQQNIVTASQLALALEAQKKSGAKLGQVLIETGYATEEGIARALAKQLGAPFIDLRQYNARPEVVRLLPETQARRFRALMLDEKDGTLLVGMADPTDLTAFDEICRLVRRPVDLAVVMRTHLLAAVDRVYHRTEEITGLAKELTADMTDATAGLDEMFGSGIGGEDAPVVKLLQTVFDEALRAHASDIHIEPQEKSLIIRFRIDGVLHIKTEADSKVASALVLRLKLTAGLDISEKRLPQDGRFNIKVRGAPLDVRISTMPTQYGESVVMRLLAQNTELLGLDKVNMPPYVLERLRNAIHRPSGMVLVTGPTGSGKTTTLYAALSELNTTEKKIITVEDPVEYRLAGINQVQVHEKIDLTFERVLRSVLRQDPDIVLVGEMRDHTTAEIGMRASMTGHMVLSTLHTNDAISTPVRLIDMGVPRYMVALSLQLVLAQRLVRVICEDCAEPYSPLPNEEAWARTEIGDRIETAKFKRGRGCSSCGGSGYKGRQGVYELLEMNSALVEAANHHDTNAFIAEAKIAMAGKTLRSDALRLALMGRTSVQEAMRIDNQQD